MSHQFSTELVVPTDLRFLTRETPNDELLQAIGVDPVWRDWIRILDKTDSLVLVHYLTTFKSKDNLTVNEEPFQFIGHVRGIVVNTEDMTIVCKSFGYTPEVVSDDVEKLDKYFGECSFDPMNVRYYYAVEGTIMRMFWFKDQWYVSTHRKINAMNSFWSGPTFGTMFNELSQFKFDDLNKNWCYVMLLSHVENRIVYKLHTNGQLMMVTIYDRTTNSFMKYDDWYEYTPNGVIFPTPVMPTNVQELVELVNSQAGYMRFDRAGVIAFTTGGSTPVKVVNTHYNELRSVRGNDPHLKVRYINLRGTPDGEKLVAWYNEPKNIQVYSKVEVQIAELVQKLHSMYINRYIKKNYGELPKEDFVVLKRCHDWHTTDRMNNIVTLEKVRQVLNTTPPHCVLRMLKRMKIEKKLALKAQPTSIVQNT